jgi:hypothetical protein
MKVNGKTVSIGSHVVESTGQRRSWDRRTDESAKAFEAFTMFRDAAERRTLRSVAEQLHCSGANIRRWSARHDWHTRVLDFDVDRDEQHRAAMARDRIAMRERQARLGMLMQGIAAHALAEWQRKIEQGVPLNLTVDEIVRLLDVGARLQQKARGEEREHHFTKIEVILGETPGDDEPEPPIGTLKVN